MRWAGQVALMLEKTNAHSFRGKDRTKDTTEKTRHRWKNDIKMDAIETGLGGMD
jgi:hypothetical protein